MLVWNADLGIWQQQEEFNACVRARRCASAPWRQGGQSQIASSAPTPPGRTKSKALPKASSRAAPYETEVIVVEEAVIRVIIIIDNHNI